MLDTLLCVVFAAASVLTPAAPDRLPPPAGAEVYIIEPADGATVPKEFTVKFGLRGMGVAPAGINVDKTGHHHLLIDVVDMPWIDYGIPNDDKHRHFGGGQTEATITLAPGTHTLQLMLADHAHIPFDPPLMSKKITVTVAP